MPLSFRFRRSPSRAVTHSNRAGFPSMSSEGHMPVRCPQFQLGVSARAASEDTHSFADTSRSRTPVGRGSDRAPRRSPHHRREPLDGFPQPASPAARHSPRAPSSATPGGGSAASAITSVSSGSNPRAAVLDQMMRVAVVALVADVHADVVEQCAVFQPLALAITETVRRPALVEDAQGEARDLLRMFQPEAATLASSMTLRRRISRIPLGLPYPRRFFWM